MGVSELPVEPGLADAGLAHDGHHLPVPGPRALERLAELLQLALAADEAGEAAGGRGLEARAHRGGPGQLVDLERRREPLDGQRAQRLDLHVPLGERQRLRREQDRPRHGHLLHAGGHVGGLADGGVVHVQIAADGAHDDLAGVQADADLDGDALRAADLLGVALDRLLHPQRGIAGADRVVLVGERRAEERHDPVAHDLVDGALVAVDGLHHALEHGVEELARLLGIAVGEQLHRALEVGEEHGDLLALALQGGLGGEDLLGEVLGGVGLRRGEPRL